MFNKYLNEFKRDMKVDKKVMLIKQLKPFVTCLLNQNITPYENIFDNDKKTHEYSDSEFFWDEDI